MMVRSGRCVCVCVCVCVGSGDEKMENRMEHAGVKAAKCDPSEVSDSRRASVLQLCARLPLICCQRHSARLSPAAGEETNCRTSLIHG